MLRNRALHVDVDCRILLSLGNGLPQQMDSYYPCCICLCLCCCFGPSSGTLLLGGCRCEATLAPHLAAVQTMLLLLLLLLVVLLAKCCCMCRHTCSRPERYAAARPLH
jgi:hypothetical protein